MEKCEKSAAHYGLIANSAAAPFRFFTTLYHLDKMLGSSKDLRLMTTHLYQICVFHCAGDQGIDI